MYSAILNRSHSAAFIGNPAYTYSKVSGLRGELTRLELCTSTADKARVGHCLSSLPTTVHLFIMHKVIVYKSDNVLDLGGNHVGAQGPLYIV